MTSWLQFITELKRYPVTFSGGRIFFSPRTDEPFIQCKPCRTPISTLNEEFHYLMCCELRRWGVKAAGCLWFTLSSPWQHAEKGSCLPLHWYPRGEKINRLSIQCPGGHLSLGWPWPQPVTIPAAIKQMYINTSRLSIASHLWDFFFEQLWFQLVFLTFSLISLYYAHFIFFIPYSSEPASPTQIAD